MSNKYPGGLVTLNPPVQNPALGAATPGIWTVDQALNAETNRSWAMYDPYYNNVVLNLHGNGTNGAQNNTFLDSSSNNFTITRNGNTTQGAFNPYQQNGYWSNYFDGSSNIVGSLSSALGTGDFTVEFWVYIVSNTGTGGEGGFLQTTSSSTGLSTSEYGVSSLTMQRNSGTNTYGFTVGGTSVPFSNSGTYLNQWMHIACVRSSGTVRIYMNGVLNSTPTTATTNLTGTYIGIGGYYNGSYLCNAYIANFRATSTVVYSGNFTPSTTPLTAITGTLFLGCQSNRFLNTSSGAAMTVNTGTPSVQAFNPFLQNLPYESSRLGGSGYFDGSGDYLNSAITAIGTNDFTVEYYSYLISHSGTNNEGGYFQISGTAGGLDTTFSVGIIAARASAGNGRVLSVNVGGTNILTTYVPGLGEWFHTAIVRQTNSVKVYVNGVLVSTPATISTNLTGAYVALGGYYSTSYLMNGYLSGFRVVNSAVYTAAFTVPTTPLTAITNTQLLCNMTNAGIFDNATMNNWETAGNAQISTSTKKYGTGSIYLDGNDYLVAPSNPYFAIGANEDYTIECWVNYTVVQTGAYYQATNNLGAASGQIWFGYEGGALKSSQHGSGTYAVSYTWSPSTGTWYHVAATRASGTVRLFINGTVVTTNSSTQSGIAFTQSGAAVGVLTSPAYFYGYIDDLRVTKGVARYLGNFTPPTSQLQDQ